MKCARVVCEQCDCAANFNVRLSERVLNFNFGDFSKFEFDRAAARDSKQRNLH